MASHEKFSFATLDQLRQKIRDLGVDIGLSDDLSPLQKPVRIGDLTAPNALAALPMEGCDSLPDGSPSELVERRYKRFEGGGAGLLWWEACAVVEEGKANDLQMTLTRQNAGRFAALLANANGEAARRNGADHRPVNVLQLTHSGRYSRPHGHRMIPFAPQRDPLLDPRVGLGPGAPLVSDAYLDDMIGRYALCAKLAMEAGFDGVDIKACHRYLISELLAGHTRQGKYGGNFDNRTRFLLDVIGAVRRETGSRFLIACRFNAFDAHPYPYGFGGDREDMWRFDPAEPAALTRLLVKNGVGLLSNSAGNPYYIYPQVTRPFDLASAGVPLPEEHPLESVARLLGLTRSIQKEAGDVPVVGSGYSWLRQFIPCVGAASIASGGCAFVGLGRSSFAYPDAPRDIWRGGTMDPQKCCVSCSRCTQIMRDHGRTGCVIRDAQVYGPLYAQYREEAIAREGAK